MLQVRPSGPPMSNLFFWQMEPKELLPSVFCNRFVHLIHSILPFLTSTSFAQVLEAPSVYVFGELLDHPNIKALAEGGSADGLKYFNLLNIFAFGTYKQYLAEQKK